MNPLGLSVCIVFFVGGIASAAQERYSVAMCAWLMAGFVLGYMWARRPL